MGAEEGSVSKIEIPNGFVCSGFELRRPGYAYNVHAVPEVGWWVYAHKDVGRGVIASSDTLTSHEAAIAWIVAHAESCDRAPGPIAAQDVDANGAPVESAP